MGTLETARQKAARLVSVYVTRKKLVRMGATADIFGDISPLQPGPARPDGGAFTDARTAASIDVAWERRRHKIPQPDPELSERQRGALERAKEQFEATLKSAKSLYDKMNRELAEVRLVEARLASQPWGKGALEYLQENTKVQLADCSEM